MVKLFLSLYPICVALWVAVMVMLVTSPDKVKKLEIITIIVAGGINVYLAPAFFRTLNL